MRRGEAPDPHLVCLEQAGDELGSCLLYDVELRLHAAAAVEHHDERYRLRIVGKLRDRLQFAVVVDLEVVAGEIGNQPAPIVGHRRIDGNRARATTELRFLTEQPNGQRYSNGAIDEQLPVQR